MEHFSIEKVHDKKSSFFYNYIYLYSCSYTHVLAHYPYVVLASVLVVSVTCLIVTAIIGDVPSFEEPLAVSICTVFARESFDGSCL